MTAPGVTFDGLRLRVGESDIYRVADIDRIVWSRLAMFKDLDAETFRSAVQKVPHAATETASDLVISFNCYVIDTPDYLCLIDAGVGNDKERPDRPAWHRRTGDFLDQLGRLGFAPTDFDIVINTHLHADHVGWNTRVSDHGWVPAFPNARYIVPAAELDYWRRRDDAQPDGQTLHGAFADSVKPIIDAGRYEAVEPPCQIAPGLWLEPAPGHTPGMAIVRLVAGDTEVFFLADVLHSPIQLATPDLTSNFCTDAEMSRATRWSLLQRCAETGALAATYHFPPPVFGRIEPEGGGYALRPVEVTIADETPA